MRNRLRTASPATRTYIDDTAEEVTIPPAPPAEEPSAPPSEEPPAEEPSEQATEDDDSWLDELTPYTEQKPTESPQVQHTPAEQAQESDGTEEQQRRLKELYAGLEHVDEDVAQELDNKLLAPIRAEVSELKAIREQELKNRQTQLVANANTQILSKHPRADKILGSQQFKDFVNAGGDPYATEQAFDRILRAYYAGDGAYVVKHIDAFVSTRGKPKPPVGAEPTQGTGGNNISSQTEKRPMSDAEYLAKRQAIKSAPRGTYPPNALKLLAEEYQQSRG